MLRHVSTFFPLTKSQIVFITASSAVKIPTITLPRIGKPSLTVELKPSCNVHELVEQQFQHNGITSLELFSLNGTKYSSKTPVADIVHEPFIVRVDGSQAYTVVNYNISKISLPYAPEDRVLAEKYYWEHGLSSKASEVLAFFNRNLIDNLDLLEGNKVTRDLFRALVGKVVLERANELRKYAKTLTIHIEALEDIYRDELKAKVDFEALAAKSADRKLTAFVSVIMAQFAAVQYGTYYLFSWDIMEPITCMMAMGDTFLAYWFWMRSSHSYDTDGIVGYLYNRKLDKLYRKSRYSRSHVEHIAQLVHNLKEKRREFIS